ncbi:antibiotic biosynthesis monooxygenase [Colwellia psychrerythraea]|uniref:antibiotic biosynthesis monooxygenase n=1 Tax=Colwellia psychrerythraea TaxID=28229 RepID=UPI0009D683E9
MSPIGIYKDNDNPAQFIFYENWETRELWEAHMANDHLKEYMEATQGVVESFTLNEMTNIS